MAKNIVCNSDALSELLVSVDLDVYINRTKSGFRAKDQEGQLTCYAFASATVLHLAMQRIHGREGKYPSFDELKDKIIKNDGTKGEDTETVLQEICEEYQFLSENVSVEKAKKAIDEKRLAVVTRFRLTQQQWENFEDFYTNNPTGILTKNILGPPGASETEGHAVVLVSYNSQCLIFMNSWGEEWPDKGMNGLFKVQNSEVLPKLEFFDVYLNLDKLTEEKKKEYRKHGSEVAGRLVSSLKGLHKAEYTCPKCEQTLLVTQFTGTLLKVQCPKCHEEFSTNDKEGNILALNMYLTSLSKCISSDSSGILLN